MRFLLLSLLAIGSFTFAQDYRMKVSSQKRSGFSFDKYPLPSGIQLYTLDKEKQELNTGGKLTFLQVWSICCGAEPDVWSKALDLSADYREYGLQTISVNFENGSGVREQLADVKQFLQGVAKPDKVLVDGLGYIVDFMKVSGFPTYFLVDKENNVVFRTNGKDPEGLKLLRQEIENRLN